MPSSEMSVVGSAPAPCPLPSKQSPRRAAGESRMRAGRWQRAATQTIGRKACVVGGRAWGALRAHLQAFFRRAKARPPSCSSQVDPVGLNPRHGWSMEHGWEISCFGKNSVCAYLSYLPNSNSPVSLPYLLTKYYLPYLQLELHPKRSNVGYACDLSLVGVQHVKSVKIRQALHTGYSIQ